MGAQRINSFGASAKHPRDLELKRGEIVPLDPEVNPAHIVPHPAEALLVGADLGWEAPVALRRPGLGRGRSRNVLRDRRISVIGMLRDAVARMGLEQVKHLISHQSLKARAISEQLRRRPSAEVDELPDRRALRKTFLMPKMTRY